MEKKKTGFNTSMKDVAHLAGVSTMTISRALRFPERVHPETLARIKEVINLVGYVPNQVAGNLSSNRTTQIALIVPSLGNALYADMIQGISSTLQEKGYQLMISDCGYSLDLEEKLISAYISHRVCGIILHNTRHTARARNALLTSRIPCVETGNLDANPIDMLVSYSNYRAGYAMAQHLSERGYERIGFASLPIKHSDRLRQRKQGFIAGLRKAGIAIDPAVAIEAESGLASGGRALARLLEIDPKLDAIFFAGDVLAAGAILECQRRGLKVPSDIAISASDDNDLMQNIHPALSTVRFPRFEIGQKSAELIIARVEGKETGQTRIDVGFNLIQREST